jgi:hypothetical protein
VGFGGRANLVLKIYLPSLKLVRVDARFLAGGAGSSTSLDHLSIGRLSLSLIASGIVPHRTRRSGGPGGEGCGTEV